MEDNNINLQIKNDHKAKKTKVAIIIKNKKDKKQML